jgi:site-specific recombinase XerD
MLHHSELKLSFYCRKAIRNQQEASPIVLRVRLYNQIRDVFTGLACDYQHWDSHAQRISGKDKATAKHNEMLHEILVTSRQRYELLKASKKYVDLDLFINVLKGQEFKVLVTISDYLEDKVKELKGRLDIDVTKATVQKYTRCIKHMKEFLTKKYRRADIPVNEISGEMITEFFYFLRTTQKNSHNTSVNYVKCLKTVLMHAIKTRVLEQDPFYGIKIAPKTVVRGFLSIEEIRRLEGLIGLTEGLKQARDIFLFACYTGMAYIDVKQFSKRNLIRDHEGGLCIHKHRQKTGILSIIPVLAPAERILQQYSPTSDACDFQWHVITNQKMNEHLKTLQKLAGIEQEMYFHLARHTFATTITLSNGVPLETVSEMLGHTNTKMTKRYAKISGFKVKEDMRRVAAIFG